VEALPALRLPVEFSMVLKTELPDILVSPEKPTADLQEFASTMLNAVLTLTALTTDKPPIVKSPVDVSHVPSTMLLLPVIPLMEVRLKDKSTATLPADFALELVPLNLTALELKEPTA